ncbi:hypothetical protein [Cypionkella sp.]|uniref:hypothetical protein n=1 Tax=Cypionkella sp. TaxID=2811411 RepID=UPI0027516332|nr:hypothetical protein [Cypionkella sp.]
MQPPENSKKTQEAAREARLKAALKANMARRKAQTRGRAAQDAEASDDLNTDNE